MENIYDVSKNGLEEALKDSVLEAYELTKSRDTETLYMKGCELISGVSFITQRARPKTITVKNKKVLEDGTTVETQKTQILRTEDLTFTGLTGAKDTYALYKRLADLSIIPQTLPFKHTENINKYVKACKILFPNVDAYNVGNCMTVFSKVLENIWANCNEPGAKKQQTCMYQYSAQGGTGKSNFHEHLRRFCNKYGINNSESRINGRWIGSEFTSNLVTTIGEYFPPRNGSEQDDTIINTNNIIDNTYYQVEYKCQQPVYVMSKTTVFINSNKLPFDANTRRYGVVKYNEKPYSTYTRDEKDTYFHTDEEIEKALLDAFESVPFETDFRDEVEQANTSYTDIILSARNLMVNGDFSVFNPNEVTPREWAKMELELKGIFNNPDALKKEMFKIRAQLRDAVAHGVITPSKRVNGNTDYSKYNIQDIAHLSTVEDEKTCSLDSIDNLLERTSKAFDVFITPESPDDDPLKPTDETFTEEDLMEEKTPVCDNKYSKPTFKPNEKTQFLVTASYKDEFIKDVVEGKAEINRCGDNMVPEYFVYESDDMSIDEQKEVARSLLRSEYAKYVKSVTLSGGKSLHILIKIGDGEKLTKYFKHWWKQTANTLFGEAMADKMDKACASVGRLSRFPNGTRDNGTKQTCLYFNKNAESWTISQQEIDAKEWAENIQTRENEIKASRFANKDKPEVETLTNFYNANPEKWALAYDTLVNNLPIPSGSDMIGTISRLKKAELFECSKLFAIKANQQHPSNIPLRRTF